MHMKMVGGDSAGVVTAFYVSDFCFFSGPVYRETLRNMNSMAYGFFVVVDAVVLSKLRT